VYGAHFDHGVSYTLYLMTYALDSVADIFGSLFAFAAGVLVFRSGVLPRWLAWVSILVAILLFVQAFGLGGVMASFGLVVDLIGFVLLLFFVLASCVILLRRESAFGLAGGKHRWSDADAKRTLVPNVGGFDNREFAGGRAVGARMVSPFFSQTRRPFLRVSDSRLPSRRRQATAR